MERRSRKRKSTAIERRLLARKKSVPKWKKFIKNTFAATALATSQFVVVTPLIYLTCAALNFKEDLRLAKEDDFQDSSLMSFVVGEDPPDEVFDYIDFPGSTLALVPDHNRRPSNEISKKDILSDKEKRISPEFRVPEALYNRTAFWYDVYTKYSNQQHVFHNRDFPWIVYSVSDVTSIMKNTSYKNKWTKFHLAKQKVVRDRQRVRSALLALAKKDFNKLTGEDLALYKLFDEIPGKNRRKIIRDAAYTMRTQTGQREFIEKGISESAQYLPHMENVFSEQGLPTELTRMPFVESSFNTAAESKVGASGIWQFMPTTGKQFMKVGDHIDERNSPLKATVAAAKLLKQYYKALGAWPLAVTAYNHGLGSLQEAVKKTKSKDISYIINNYRTKSFDFASPNFFPSFLAILHAEKYHDAIYGQIKKNTILAFKEVRLKKGIRISKLLRVLKMDMNQFKFFNKDISDDSFKLNLSLPRGFRLHLPDKYLDKYVEYEKNLLRSRSQGRITITSQKKRES